MASNRVDPPMFLSRCYEPSASLRRYVSRFYVFSAELPDAAQLVDQLLAETAYVRLLIRGDWQAETAPGEWGTAGSAILFGSNSRPMKVRVKGAFTVIGVGIRPSGWHALFGLPAAECADLMLPLDLLWGDAAQRLVGQLSRLSDDVSAIAWLEAVMRQRLGHIDDQQACSRAWAFEQLTLGGGINRVGHLAECLDMSPRQLERFTIENFGHRPKTILRRQRFLSIATAMRGIGKTPWDVLASEQFYDQSHLNREFHRFAGVTPQTFLNEQTPLLDAGLRLRADALREFRRRSPLLARAA